MTNTGAIYSNRPTFLAEVALTKGVAVSRGTDPVNEVALPTAGARIVGVTLQEATINEDVSVQTEGFVLGTAGTGGITAGDFLKVDANGAFVATTTGTDIVVAEAYETFAAGEVGNIKLLNTGVLYSALA